VQLIEHTDFGVRSAFYTYAKQSEATRFVLLPMLHLGSPSFFENVQRTLNTCDVVLAEGVPGWRARVLTLAYRLGGRLRRSELVTQGDALDVKSLKGEVICPDLSEDEFKSGWGSVRWWLRWTLLVLAPFFGLWMMIAGPERVLLSRRLTLDDFPSPDELGRGATTGSADGRHLLGGGAHARSCLCLA